MTNSNLLTRRLALFRLAATSTVAAAATAPALIAPKARAESQASLANFEHPAEYLTAMEAIGWRPIAMFQRLRDGGVHCMGVAEHSACEEQENRNWSQFHAIQMRVPVQRAADMQQGDWWRRVWQHLYDNGLREDVTPPKMLARLTKDDAA